MKTVFKIIEEAGGLTNAECISVENEPWMRLVIEVLPERGPDGHVVVSVAHYGEQNGDPMRDPEMLFEVVEEVGKEPEFWPFYFRNDYSAVEQWSRRRDEAGNLHSLPKRTHDFEQFAKMWDRNLREQGFLEAFRRRACGQTECSVEEYVSGEELRTMTNTSLQCDFCSAAGPVWRYPARSFVAYCAPNVAGESVGDWAACDQCHVLIETDTREAWRNGPWMS